MNTLIIRNSTKEELKRLLDYIETLEGVEIEYPEDAFEGMPVRRRDPNSDPLELAGIWKGKEITLEKIRKQAWRDHK